MLRSRFWLLLLGLLGACALPLNTAVRDWSRSAGIAVARADAATPGAARAMRQALSTYFQALGVLWDGAALAFDETRFAALAPQVPDPAAAQAIVELGRLLRAASDETPPRWLPPDNSGPTPAYEDRRLSTLIRAADGPVQLLLAALSATLPVAGTGPPSPLPTGPAQAEDEARDPALRQARLERAAREARLGAEQETARHRQAAVLARIAEGHAMLAARAGRIRQRSTELELRVAEDRLRRTLTDRGMPARETRP